MVVGRRGRRVLYWLYASTLNDQTIYFGLPEYDLTMDRLLDRGTAVSESLVFLTTNLRKCNLLVH